MSDVYFVLKLYDKEVVIIKKTYHFVFIFYRGTFIGANAPKLHIIWVKMFIVNYKL